LLQVGGGLGQVDVGDVADQARQGRLLTGEVGLGVGDLLLDQAILMLKANWDVPPTATPNPRVTIETEDARETEKGLRALGIEISDAVQVYDEVHYVGSFLDSEGNKIWFCSFV